MALINIVFLMLVFFMVVGTLAVPLDNKVELVDTAGLDGRPPPDAAVILPDGTMTLRGAPVDVGGILAATTEGDGGLAVRIVPDRALAATDLMDVVNALREGGAQEVWIVTERGLE